MNILYVHTHDSGRVFSPYGYRVPTPSIEKFAMDATLFRQAYCVAPTCSPSRAAMLTGVYPHQNGMLGLAQRGFKLDMSKHLVQFLNGQGYQTVLCGIQHEVGWYLDHSGGALQIGYKEELTADSAAYRQEELVDWDRKNALRAVEWLGNCQAKEQPFFLSYGMYATHRRYPQKADESICESFILPPPPMPDTPEARADHARYMTAVRSADECFSLVVEALKNNGLYDNTIILFTTDHGLANPFSKCTLYDSGIGVALIMRVPGSNSVGKIVDNMVSQIDIFPTLCDLLVLPQPDYLEGVSFARSFTDNCALTRDEIYGEINFHTSYEPIRCVRTERYKYIRYYDADFLTTNLSNIDESPNKEYFLQRELQKYKKWQEALYDLVYDVGERNNVIDDERYAEVREDLRQRLNQQMVATHDPLLQGAIPVQSGWKVNRRECQTASSKNPQDYV